MEEPHLPKLHSPKHSEKINPAKTQHIYQQRNSFITSFMLSNQPQPAPSWVAPACEQDLSTNFLPTGRELLVLKPPTEKDEGKKVWKQRFASQDLTYLIKSTWKPMLKSWISSPMSVPHVLGKHQLFQVPLDDCSRCSKQLENVLTTCLNAWRGAE